MARLTVDKSLLKSFGTNIDTDKGTIGRAFSEAFLRAEGKTDDEIRECRKAWEQLEIVEEKAACVLCHHTYEGYGNNARPLAEGDCCDSCNDKVVAFRMGLATAAQIWEVSFYRTTQEEGTVWIRAASKEEAERLVSDFVNDADSEVKELVEDYWSADDDGKPLITFEVGNAYPNETLEDRNES